MMIGAIWVATIFIAVATIMNSLTLNLVLKRLTAMEKILWLSVRR